MTGGGQRLTIGVHLDEHAGVAAADALFRHAVKIVVYGACPYGGGRSRSCYYFSG